MHHRADRLQCELEFGDDTEVPTPAADGPEQVGVVVGGGTQNAPVGRHDLGRDEVVAAEAGEFRQPPSGLGTTLLDQVALTPAYVVRLESQRR